MGLDNPVTLLLALVLGFGISAFILRAVLSIPKIVKNSKAQTRLLAEIAKANNVDTSVISIILEELR